MQSNIKNKLAVIPNQPGCYLMKGRGGAVIYIGKAKVLRSRIRSYFTGSHDGKTQRLVSEIKDFEYIVTSSDLEALVLEMNLIKKHDPHYNVMLKDDKSYPYIHITNEEQPRLITTRKIKKGKGRYFGPYPNAYAANETKKLLDRIYPLRKCKTLPDRVCLYYHLGQCLGPCIHVINEEQNRKMVEAIIRFLNGGHQEVKKDLQAKMQNAAENLEFERAQEYRDQIQHIESVMEKQKMIHTDQKDRDVFGYAYDKGWMCVQVFFVRQGKLIERDVSIFPIYRDPEDEFLSFVGQFYLQKNYLKPKEILVPRNVDYHLLGQLLKVPVIEPQRGKKKDLVELAIKNARIALSEKFDLIERDESRTIKAIENLGNLLGIATPNLIEAFDNSNIQGTNPVSAMVVFTHGSPNRKQYRKYKLKTVDGPDDYASMKEVTRRRYSRVLKENLPLPDLILIDGGKGQMGAAVDVLENELGLSIPVCGLVKDDKHNTTQLVMGAPPQIIPLSRNSQEFYLLQRIQDEVHRFAVSFHRQVREKGMIQSSLETIPGVGKKRRQALLQHFGSFKRIKEATKDELIAAKVPASVAENIVAFFSTKKQQGKS